MSSWGHFAVVVSVLSVLVGCGGKTPTPKPKVVIVQTVDPQNHVDQKVNDLARRMALLDAVREDYEAAAKLFEEEKQRAIELEKKYAELEKKAAGIEAKVETLNADANANKKEISGLRTELSEIRRVLAKIQEDLAGIEANKQLLQKVAKAVQQNQMDISELKALHADVKSLSAEIQQIEKKLEDSRRRNNLAAKNRQLMLKNLMNGHTGVYALEGDYNVMVIPVQFTDIAFEKESLEYMSSGGMQKDLFDSENPKSMRTYYRHASLGKFDVKGEVLEPITVSQNREFYGKALANRRSDQDAPALVKEALVQLRDANKPADWWYQFDKWDLNDYDGDGNYREPDGFIDAVVLVYAGKSQASCQRSFDPKGERPASDSVPPGPRQQAAVECFNRIWPHRSAIMLNANDDDYVQKGPVVDGKPRPSFNGLKINDHLFATDYNMQSEYSDLSTFMHEFGHSITLPDVYAGRGENSVGAWTLMASNASDQAQELSTYSKLSLGWIKPKVIHQSEASAVYLGAYNFVTENQRNQLDEGIEYVGPDLVDDDLDKNGEEQTVSIVSKYDNENVYRSLIVTTEPDFEEVKVAEMKSGNGKVAVYSGRHDGDYRSFVKVLNVPKEGDASLTLDMIHHIETQHDFDSKKPMEPKKWVYYDKGFIKINDEVVDQLALFSGDEKNTKGEAQQDTLNENAPGCNPERVMALREKRISSELSEEEKAELKAKLGTCQRPTWVKKKIDLEKYRGQSVKFEVAYLTDGAYTDFGILFDNVKLGETVLDFEEYESDDAIGQFKALKNGVDNKHYARFYLFEYRDTKTVYEHGGEEASFNMDRNIKVGSQSYFKVDAEKNAKENFRHVQMDYESGVLVWYYNSKFDPHSAGNGATAHDHDEDKGKGYLLVLNSEVKEVPIPGLFSREDLFNEKGFYKNPADTPEFKELIEGQREMLGCFGYTRYFKYLHGRDPNCDAVGEEFKDYLPKLKYVDDSGERHLMYRRERFNDVLPKNRYASVGVGVPFRTAPGIRTGLAPFKPDTAKPAKPFFVWRAEGDQMTLDEEATHAQHAHPPVSSFSDAMNKRPDDPRYLGDTVQVEKVGFNFKVYEPDFRAEKYYDKEVHPDSNLNFHRRPLVKVDIEWN